ncbi:MAG: glycosyltransferase family 4 protein [Desulfovibrio sp.]|jgi:glycosyltransferase involved in cell wall biosynthesis|nr:glycosyltransferase family 4 protein [Desulfovibrio sp.]
MRILYCQKLRFPNNSAHALHCALTAANFAASGAETFFFPGVPRNDARQRGFGLSAFFAGLGYPELPELLRLEVIGTTHKGFYGWMFRRRLRKAASGSGVCFASSVKEAGMALDLRESVRGLRVVFEMHHLISRLKEGGEAKKLYELEKRVFRNADLVIFNSATLEGNCRNYLPACRNSLVSPLGYNERTIRPARDPDAPEPSGAGGLINLAYVGSLQAGKGLENLILALPKLGDEFVLNVVGGVPERGLRALRQLVAELRLEVRVRFAGHLPQAEIAPRLADCDIFVIPMDTEKDFFAPMKMYEALGFALPIVATPMPSLRKELADGENALFAAGCAPADLADAVRRLAADPDLRGKMRRNNFAAARRLSSGRRAEKLLELFRAISG